MAHSNRGGFYEPRWILRWALEQRAKRLNAEGRYVEAFRLYSKALALQPGRTKVQRRLAAAAAKCISKGDHEIVIEQLPTPDVVPRDGPLARIGALLEFVQSGPPSFRVPGDEVRTMCSKIRVKGP